MNHDDRPTAPLPDEALSEIATERALRKPVLRRRRADTIAADLPPPLDPNPNRRLPCLTTIRGQLPGRLFVLSRGTNAIGRGVANDITLTDTGVSRRHAKLEVGADSVTLRDLGSSNGTFMSGRRVQEATLGDRAKFTLGTRVTLRLDWLDAEDRAFQDAQFEALTRDALTLCHNRSYLDEELLRAASVAHRGRQPLSVLVLDLDHFKSVNDRWGHAVGDAVLRATAKAALGAVRVDDVLARVGGEEFVLLMPQTRLEAAVRVAERVRAAVAATNVTAPDGQTVRVTASVGVASLGEADPVEPEAVLSLADARLFLAKDQGRDRVISAGGKPQGEAVWRMGTDRSSRSLAAHDAGGRRRRTTITGDGRSDNDPVTPTWDDDPITQG